METTLIVGSAVVIRATTDRSTLSDLGGAQVEIGIDVTVLTEHLTPRRTRAHLTVDPAAVRRIHPGAELVADLTVDGRIVTLHVPTTNPTTTANTIRVPTFETTADTAWRQK